MDEEISQSGITWEAIGMTVTIITTIAIPLMVFIWVTGRKFGLHEQIHENLLAKDAEHDKTISEIRESQSKRDIRLYDNIGDIKSEMSDIKATTSELRGYMVGQKKSG